MKKVLYLLCFVIIAFSFVLSNPNCPTGYTMAPTSTGTSRNCTNCHGDYSLNTAGGSITLTGLPTTFTAGVAYPFSIKIAHSAADRKVWGYAIKAVDTTTNTVVGTWTSTNANSSIKGTAGGATYELSHANAAVTTVANNYTYTGLTWNAPSVAPSKVKFYVSAVAGDNNGNEAMDYVYTKTFISAKYVAPPPTATVPTTQVITQTPVSGLCDTLRTFSVPVESGVNYAWSISGTGNYIISATSGQGTNSITAAIKAAGSVYLTLSNNSGSIPTVSSAFTRSLPPSPVSIVGYVAPCPNSTFTYTTSAAIPTSSQVANSVFRWTVPVGSTITAANTDSSSVTIRFGSTFSTGAITVKCQSACNIVSAAKSLAVAPAKPLDMSSSTGFWNGCIGNSATYSVISAVPSVSLPPGVAFRWTKPANTTFTYANADSSVVTLQFNTGYTGGPLTAKATTLCGTLSTPISKTLTHINCAFGTRIGVEDLQKDLVALYPIPNNGNFTLNVQSTITKTAYANVNIIDVTGRTVYSERIKSVDGVLSKDFSLNLQRGMYALYYIINNKRTVIKFIVQ
jgi:hypothetical protein